MREQSFLTFVICGSVAKIWQFLLLKLRVEGLSYRQRKKLPISWLLSHKSEKLGHFILSNFKSWRKESVLSFFIEGPGAEIWPLSHFSCISLWCNLLIIGVPRIFCGEPCRIVMEKTIELISNKKNITFWTPLTHTQMSSRPAR